MRNRTVVIVAVLATVLAVGVGLLLWGILGGSSEQPPYSVIDLDKYGEVESYAHFTRLENVGDMFWWFYPTMASEPTSRPLILWLNGVTGVPASLLANFGMFGPLDLFMENRTESWIDEYNLLFIDAPIGMGFSNATMESDIPRNVEHNTDHLMYTLEAFYSTYPDYIESPLYIFGQEHGAQFALSLAIRLSKDTEIIHNLQGVAIINGIITPGLVLSRLGYYLEEFGYVDGIGRQIIEDLSEDITSLLDEGRLEEAYTSFINLEHVINSEASATSVNMRHVVEKMELNATTTDGVHDYFNQMINIRGVNGLHPHVIMRDTVGQVFGISEYNTREQEVIHAFRGTFMIPATNKVEYILQNTNLTVSILNGNLDAISNTPGQLLWINNLQWNGQTQFLSSPRLTLAVNSQIEGYYKGSGRLQLYWVNVAGQWVPHDNPVAMRRILRRITESE